MVFLGAYLVYAHIHMEVSINGGTPIAGWFTMENPIEMEDLGVLYPYFEETTILYIYVYKHNMYVYIYIYMYR